MVSARRVISGEVKAGVRIQDEGSQLIAELAGRGKEILDCCAAPGGKTAILAARNPAASITACDISPVRLKAMQKNLPGLGIHFRVLDATQLPFEKEFDLVLCDAPCSGTGTLARNPEIRYRLMPADLARHHERQVYLLRSAMRALRERGSSSIPPARLRPRRTRMLWLRFLKRKSGSVCFPGETRSNCWSATAFHAGTADRLAAGDFLRTFPGLYPGDGFFAACLVRN